MQIVHSIDKLGIWPRLPVLLGLLYLAIRRHLHQEYNLFNVGTTPTVVRFNEVAGSQGTFFGRNMLPVDQKKKVHNQSYTYIKLVNEFHKISAFLPLGELVVSFVSFYEC